MIYFFILYLFIFILYLYVIIIYLYYIYIIYIYIMTVRKTDTVTTNRNTYRNERRNLLIEWELLYLTFSIVCFSP